jgi:glyoxalase superfamily protein
VSKLEAVVVHCANPIALATFYATVLGLQVDPSDLAAIDAATLGSDEAVLLGSRDQFHVWFVPTSRPRGQDAPIHFDIRLEDPRERDELVALGAVHRWFGRDGAWEVLADPEGNLFCIFPPAVT